MPPHYFPQSPPNSIPHHRPPNPFRRYQPDPKMRFIRYRQHADC